MKKLAVFVEGLTEQVFVQRLLTEIAGRHRMAFTVRKMSGGATGRRFIELESSRPEGATHYALIYDCSGDSTVLSDMRDQYATLAQSGYSRILGLRDLYPVPLQKKQQVMDAMARNLPTGSVPARMILAVMEIEAWFLAEETHYSKIDPALTIEVVANALGDSPGIIDMEAVLHPAGTLDTIYQVAGKRYCKDRKIRKRIERTVEALDWAHLYVTVSQRIDALKSLCNDLDQFLR